MTQVQVGCVEHCYGSTTLDHSGLTVAQIEQLLGQLQPPSPPVASPAPASEQNVTQQASAQSQNGDGKQSQVATQSNGTVQVAPASGGAPAAGAPDAGAGAAPAAVNETSQGVVQLQVGCIFYCSGTRQSQTAQQSTTTVQSVNSGGAGATNTVSRGLWQVQVGCVVWCYDTVETQTAGGSDSAVVTVAPGPSAPTAASDDAVSPPGPGSDPAPGPTARIGGRPRPSGGAALQVPGAGRGAGARGAVPPAIGGEDVTGTSVSESALAQVGGGGALLSVASTRTSQIEVTHRAPHRGRRGPKSNAPTLFAPPAITAAGPTTVAATSTVQPTLELLLALAVALTVLGSVVRRWHGVG